MDKNIGLIVSARMGSNRLPGKACKLIQGIPMLEFLLTRIRKAKNVDKFILATTDKDEDGVLSEIAIKKNFNVFRGSENNLIERYVMAARQYNVNTVIRVTGDCPFVDGEMIDYCINQINGKDFDLASTKGNFPEGLDLEIYKSISMQSIRFNKRLTDEDKEHLTLFYYNNSLNYKILDIRPPVKWYGKASYTVDNPEDYSKIQSIANQFKGPFFGIDEIIKLEKNDY